MPHFDIGYFKKKIKRSSISGSRGILNKFNAWKLNEEYYDGKRINGYGGFKYDGRWKKILPKIIKRYKLNNNFKILEIGCKKGFLLYDLKCLIPRIKVVGIENHAYPILKADKKIRKHLLKKNYYDLKSYKKNEFDLVIGFNSIYMQNLGDVIKTLEQIARISRKSYISIASYKNKTDRDRFLDWTLLGTTILKKEEWRKIFKLVSYNGDYYFSDAKKLGL